MAQIRSSISEDLYDPILTYNPQPLANLSSALPEIHFSSYVSTFAPRAFPAQVIVTHPPFATSLSKILSNTSSDAIEAYLVTRAALTLSPHLGLATEQWQAVRTLEETLKGIKKGAVGDRAEYCIGRVERALGFASGRYFVEQVFGGDSREKGTRVITGEPIDW
jgi:endothelin-converting enzyme